MKIRVFVSDGFVRKCEIEDKERILGELERLGVSDPNLLLNAWIDSYDSSDLTVFQAELLRRTARQVLDFLDSITKVEEV